MTGRAAADRLDEWPVDRTAYITLDLEHDYGTALDEHRYEAAERAPALGNFLADLDVPLTCFLQTELLDAVPDAVAGLEAADTPVEFHPHSHTHPHPDDADMPAEIERSVRAVRDRFGTDDLGFRFPDGAADPADFRTLADHGVSFSASVFPSWRPGRFDNRGAPLYPFRRAGTDLVELPFTVYSRRLRIPVALSYLKLLGTWFERLVRARPPNVVVFDMHMHDLVTPSTVEELPRPYRLVYSRRSERGPTILARLVAALRDAGYRFGRMSDLYERTAAALDGRGQREVLDR